MIRHFSVTRFCARLFLFRRAINDSLIIIIIKSNNSDLKIKKPKNLKPNFSGFLGFFLENLGFLKWAWTALLQGDLLSNAPRLTLAIKKSLQMIVKESR